MGPGTLLNHLNQGDPGGEGGSPTMRLLVRAAQQKKISTYSGQKISFFHTLERTQNVTLMVLEQTNEEIVTYCRTERNLKMGPSLYKIFNNATLRGQNLREMGPKKWTQCYPL